MNKLKHIAVIFAALFLFAGVPYLLYGDLSAVTSGADAVSSATIELPEQPSGEFTVLVNTGKHPDTAADWQTFFSGGDAGVIMEDIGCVVIDTDAAGVQLAERYQARLAKNQMSVKRENGLLLASKAEYNMFDVLIVSKEMADVYSLQTVYNNDGIMLINVRGE